MNGRRQRRRLPRRRAPPRPVVKKLPLGRLLHYVKTGHLVVEMKESPRGQPRLGAKVVKGDGTLVGVLADVIGPVERPYAVVKPEKGLDVSTLKAGEELFLLVERPGGRRRGGREGLGRRSSHAGARRSRGREGRPRRGR